MWILESNKKGMRVEFISVNTKQIHVGQDQSVWTLEKPVGQVVSSRNSRHLGNFLLILWSWWPNCSWVWNLDGARHFSVIVDISVWLINVNISVWLIIVCWMTNTVLEGVPGRYHSFSQIPRAREILLQSYVSGLPKRYCVQCTLQDIWFKLYSLYRSH